MLRMQSIQVCCINSGSSHLHSDNICRYAPYKQPATHTPPSRTTPVHYLAQVDHWFSSHPLSKLLLLLVLTVSLITLGGLSLFAASDHSLYDATWAAVAGAGLNWSFWDGAGAAAATDHQHLCGIMAGIMPFKHLLRMSVRLLTCIQASKQAAKTWLLCCPLPFGPSPFDSHALLVATLDASRMCYMLRAAHAFWPLVPVSYAGDHLMVRVVSLLISVGGMLITALLLGIVSGGTLAAC